MTSEPPAKKPKLSVDALQNAEISLAKEKPTVFINFRGSWCPPCREQLRGLSNRFADFQEHGIPVHGVTAQPGGDAAIRKKLVEEGVSVPFPVHSDPEMKLLARDPDDQPARDIYVHGKIDKSRDYLEGVQTNEVQPAVVVANSNGEVTRFWSWKSLFKGDELEKRITDKESIAAETTNKEIDPGLAPVSVKGLGANSNGQEDKTWIVNIRPDIDDLLPAILEDRPVKIAEVKTIAQVFDDHHQSLQRQGLTVHEAPESEKKS